MFQHRHALLRIEKDERTTTITISTEELNEDNLPTLAAQMFAIAEGLDGGRLEVDLGKVGYLTSTALGKFVGLNKRVRDRGGRLILTNLTDVVYEVFEVTQLHRVLDIRRAEGADASREGFTPLAS